MSISYPMSVTAEEMAALQEKMMTNQDKAPSDELWRKFVNLPKYSFMLGVGGVRRVKDDAGNWIECHQAGELIEEAQSEINALRLALDRAATPQSPVAGGVQTDEIKPTNHHYGATSGDGSTQAPVAQTVQAVPVAWYIEDADGERMYNGHDDFPRGLKGAPLYAAPPTQAIAVEAWQPIETAPQCKKVLAAYRNKLGNWRRIIARYYPPGMLAAHEDADDDQCDEEGYAKEGWYEESETHEFIMPTDETPVLWMPLPAAPSQGDKQ